MNNFVVRELVRSKEDMNKSTVCTWRVTDIIESAGEHSGLLLRLKEL